jgi:cobalt-zinc-cadmium efflux system membrane fusion protein
MSDEVATLSPPYRTRVWRATWMIVATVAIGWILISLFRNPPRPIAAKPAPDSRRISRDPVQVAGPSTITVASDAPLRKQLALVNIQRTDIKFPVLNVSGSILARVVPGTGAIEDRWQFSTADLSTAYAEWLKAKSEIKFAESQLQKTKDLYLAETAFLEENLSRLTPLVESGSIAQKQHREAKTNLIKAQLQGEKNTFEAQSTLRVAQNEKVAAERKLSQEGIEPVVFGRAIENMVLVSANVPESKVALVYDEQACEARFYGYFNQIFPAHVELLSASVTPDRRTLRVLIDLNDPKGVLRPGMFAEVGLGTNERSAILVPADALLHIGQRDYVVVADDENTWRVEPVTVGETHEGMCEVLSNLGTAEHVVGAGAILLKPVAAQALTKDAGTAKP